MLFAHLQGHAQGRPSGFVHRQADDAPGQLALVLLPGSEIRCRRAAEAHRDAETLGRSHGYVGAPFARRGKQRQGKDIGRYDDLHPCLVRLLDHLAVVLHRTGSGRVLQHHAEIVRLRGESEFVAFDQFDAQRFGARLEHVEGLGQDVFRNEKLRHAGFFLLAAAGVEQHQHGLGRGSAFVEQRSVGDG